MDKSKAKEVAVSLFMDLGDVVEMLATAFKNGENIYVNFNGRRVFSADMHNKVTAFNKAFFGDNYDPEKDNGLVRG